MRYPIIVFYSTKFSICFSLSKYLYQLILKLLREIFPLMKNAWNQHRLNQHVFVLIVEKMFVYYLDFYEKYRQVNEPK